MCVPIEINFGRPTLTKPTERMIANSKNRLLYICLQQLQGVECGSAGDSIADSRIVVCIDQ